MLNYIFIVYGTFFLKFVCKFQKNQLSFTGKMRFCLAESKAPAAAYFTKKRRILY